MSPSQIITAIFLFLVFLFEILVVIRIAVAGEDDSVTWAEEKVVRFVRWVLRKNGREA